MVGAIDLPTVHKVTGIPDSTLRYWVREHGWQPVGTGPYGTKLYDAVTIHRLARHHPAYIAKAEAEEAVRTT
jgi:hypothetical protein